MAFVKQTGRNKQGGLCFRQSGVEQCAVIAPPDGRLAYGGQPMPVVVVGYMPYTGHWYLFNTESGRQIATLTQSAYECFIQPLRNGDLVPGCEPVAESA